MANGAEYTGRIIDPQKILNRKIRFAVSDYNRKKRMGKINTAKYFAAKETGNWIENACVRMWWWNVKKDLRISKRK